MHCHLATLTWFRVTSNVHLLQNQLQSFSDHISTDLSRGLPLLIDSIHLTTGVKVGPQG